MVIGGVSGRRTPLGPSLAILLCGQGPAGQKVVLEVEHFPGRPKPSYSADDLMPSRVERIEDLKDVASGPLHPLDSGEELAAEFRLMLHISLTLP